jgi:hypothetical protein
MGLACGLATRYLARAPEVARLILLLTLLAGGLPLVVGTVHGLLRGDLAADIVASLAIIGALVSDEYLAGCVIVLMQTGARPSKSTPHIAPPPHWRRCSRAPHVSPIVAVATSCTTFPSRAWPWETCCWCDRESSSRPTARF